MTYQIGTFQIYIKNNIVKIVSEDYRIFQMEIDNPHELFSNKEISIDLCKNKLCINNRDKKIYVPEIIDDFDFRDIQIAELNKIINKMNDKFLLMDNKIGELENKNKLLTDKLSDHIFFEGCILPVSVNVETLGLFINEKTIDLKTYNINNMLVAPALNSNDNLCYTDIYRGSPFNSDIIISSHLGSQITDICNSLNTIHTSNHNISNIKYCRKIKKLLLFNAINQEIIGIDIYNLDTLEELILVNDSSNSLGKINLIDNNLLNLRSIRFYKCNNLIDISFLKYCKSLKQICFCDCDIVYHPENFKIFNFILECDNYINILISNSGCHNPNNDIFLNKINIKYGNTPDKNKKK